RVRFYNTVDLVNRLEAEARTGQPARIADHLCRLDLVILDELGYLPFALSAASCCSTSSAASTSGPRSSSPATWPLPSAPLSVRRRQDDHRAPRPPHPSLRHRRDRQRELAVQEPHRRLKSKRPVNAALRMLG